MMMISSDPTKPFYTIAWFHLNCEDGDSICWRRSCMYYDSISVLLGKSVTHDV